MPTALEKVLAHANVMSPAAPADEAGELLLAALALTDELQVLLAWSDDDEDDNDNDSGKGGKPSGKSGGDDDDDQGDDQMAAMVAKLVKKGVPKARAVMMAKQAMKRVKASALAEGIAVALSSLDMADGTVASIREKMAAAARRPDHLALTSFGHGADPQTLRLAVLTTAERKKPSAHTIPGSDDYPIPDRGHLTAAIARYKQGALAGHSKDEVRRHILSRARALGVQVDLG